MILYDDYLGYGDMDVNGATGFKTPNSDKFATEGIHFTDAHTKTRSMQDMLKNVGYST